jgi:aspartate/methionine/tyrosine aminotransferase
VKFCSEHNLVLMSDEVYQENVYSYKPFFSAKKIINEMGPPYNQLELASLHSVSKGLTGECGLRGGYMELVNFDPGVLQEVHKVRAMLRCPNTIGQMMVGL